VLRGRLKVIERHAGEADSGLASPGMLRKHYSPAVPLEVVEADGFHRAARVAADGARVGWLTCGVFSAAATGPQVVHVDLGNDPAEYARRLYDALHQLEAAGVERIVVAAPPRAAGWEAIHDRLSRAAAQ
jgi:L-threonylcarbamoyladenylate synthase